MVCLPIETVAEALAVRQGSPWRMEVHHVPRGPVLVVDCFHAIPASAEAAVRSLAALPGERKLAVRGVMAELGDQRESVHRRIALMAEELGIEVVGYETGLYGEAHVTGVDEAVALLRTMRPGDAVLVKGSRVARLEDVVRALRGGRGRTIAHPRRWSGCLSPSSASAPTARRRTPGARNQRKAVVPPLAAHASFGDIPSAGSPKRAIRI